MFYLHTGRVLEGYRKDTVPEGYRKVTQHHTQHSHSALFGAIRGGTGQQYTKMYTNEHLNLSIMYAYVCACTCIQNPTVVEVYANRVLGPLAWYTCTGTTDGGSCIVQACLTHK